MAYFDAVTRIGVGGPVRHYVGFAAAVSAAITGDFTEEQIVAGGEEITITLTAETWVASGATFNAQRQNIIDGLDSAQSETFGWNAEVRDKEVVGAVVKTSDTVVTITLTASAAYSISADETITVIIPATALTGAVELTGVPTIGVTASAAVALPTTGWKFLMEFDTFRQKRDEDEEERERIKEIVEAIESPVDKEIAQLLQHDADKEARAEEVEKLERLITEHATPQDLIAAEAHNVAKAFARAAMQKNFSAVEALERELERKIEEDEFLMLAFVMVI